MGQDISKKTGPTALYRKEATRSARRQIFGPVTVILPPSGMLAMIVVVVALTLLGITACLVEIPQRARAVGVLMPPDGLIDIVAHAPGRVSSIHVSEGQLVEKGDLLLSIQSGDEPLARQKLEALRMEAALLNEAHARQVAVESHRLMSLAGQMAAIEQRITVANEEYELQKEQVRLLERRLERRRDLTDNGTLAADLFDQERGLLLQARNRLAATRHAVLAFEQGLASIGRERERADDEFARRDALHDLETKRLEREIAEQVYRAGRQIRANDAGVVARVSVTTGVAIKAGDALLKLFRPYRELEAWLYLSSTRTGFVKKGQLVKLRFDAYPHQLFGTTDAIVTSLSQVAVVPWELKIPLALNGPVFEIRASLGESHIEAFGGTWPLRPGTSFRADIVQRRYKLYEWLLRGLANASGRERA